MLLNTVQCHNIGILSIITELYFFPEVLSINPTHAT